MHPYNYMARGERVTAPIAPLPTSTPLTRTRGLPADRSPGCPGASDKYPKDRQYDDFGYTPYGTTNVRAYTVTTSQPSTAGPRANDTEATH